MLLLCVPTLLTTRPYIFGYLSLRSKDFIKLVRKEHTVCVHDHRRLKLLRILPRAFRLHSSYLNPLLVAHLVLRKDRLVQLKLLTAISSAYRACRLTIVHSSTKYPLPALQFYCRYHHRTPPIDKMEPTPCI